MPDEQVCRNSQSVPDAAHHVESQGPFASHHFGNAGPAANIRLYISTAQALLLHAKLNRTNWIGCIDLEGLCFISIHESGQYVQLVAFPGTRLNTRVYQ